MIKLKDFINSIDKPATVMLGCASWSVMVSFSGSSKHFSDYDLFGNAGIRSIHLTNTEHGKTYVVELIAPLAGIEKKSIYK